MVGRQLPLDEVTHSFALLFTPWVSQIFLTLAAFNLSKRNEEDFKTHFYAKIKYFFLVFIYFVFENFMVAPNLGEAISFYPIMAWMVILSLIAFLYFRFGVQGIWFLFIISFTRWTLPPLPYLAKIEYWIQSNIHPSYEYDAQVEHLLTSGCMGFLMGYYFHHRSWGIKREFSLIGIGLILFLIWLIFGEDLRVNYLNIFDNEHNLSKTFLGNFSILGMQLMVISTFIIFEMKYKMRFKVPLINWVGASSLKLFAIHRIIFVHLFMPFILLLVTILERPLMNTWWICSLSALGIFLLGYFLEKTKIHQIILR